MENLKAIRDEISLILDNDPLNKSLPPIKDESKQKKFPFSNLRAVSNQEPTLSFKDLYSSDDSTEERDNEDELSEKTAVMAKLDSSTARKCALTDYCK